MAPPQTTRDKVRRRIVDLSETNPLAEDFAVLDEAIAAAISHYSGDRPRELVADVNGTGNEYYPLTGGSAVLAGWVDGSSSIRAIDFPASTVAAGYQPTWLDPDLDWTYYRDASVIYLRFRSAVPQTGQKARVGYTAPHVHDTTTDTIPPGDLDALCDLAAHYACQALATKYAAFQDSTLMADSTNYRDGQLRFKQQADAWLDSYRDRLGIKDGVQGASATADWTRAGTTGMPMLTHSRRWR